MTAGYYLVENLQKQNKCINLGKFLVILCTILLCNLFQRHLIIFCIIFKYNILSIDDKQTSTVFSYKIYTKYTYVENLL